ncbi:MAG: hypothetical protein ACOX4D_01385 [Bacteroidales bacterium]|jgi:hypothetical protein
MKRYIPYIIKLNIVLLSFTLFFSGCKEYNKEFPYVRFVQTFDLFMSSNVDLLQFAGSVIDSTVGYKGIVVFRRAYDEYYDDFVTFDLTCTNPDCHFNYKISVPSFSLFATCSNCGVVYDLYNYGFPTTLNDSVLNRNVSASGTPLKRYSTYYDGRYVSVEN